MDDRVERRRERIDARPARVERRAETGEDDDEEDAKGRHRGPVAPQPRESEGPWPPRPALHGNGFIRHANPSAGSYCTQDWVMIQLN
ncbi:hypothetical protein NN6n1_09370 [Shinella zoogloeoides]